LFCRIDRWLIQEEWWKINFHWSVPSCLIDDVLHIRVFFYPGSSSRKCVAACRNYLVDRVYICTIELGNPGCRFESLIEMAEHKYWPFRYVHIRSNRMWQHIQSNISIIKRIIYYWKWHEINWIVVWLSNIGNAFLFPILNCNPKSCRSIYFDLVFY
jgi:hypothetical protein